MCALDWRLSKVIRIEKLLGGDCMSSCGTIQLQDVGMLDVASNHGSSLSHEGLVPPKWYAVFTLANHEKRVAGRCAQKYVESFLPLYKTRHKWRNGCTVDLELPLFPNYFFVRIIPRDRVRVLELPGVISMVAAAGKLLPVEDDYINALRDALLVHKIEPHPYLETGAHVRIKRGPLAGAKGVLERRKNDLRVILRLEMLARSVSVEVSATEVEPCRGC
jgi:transcription antitermination factor NusG